MAQPVKPTLLRPETLAAFQSYIQGAETKMDETLSGSGSFLWSDSDAGRAQQIERGQIVAQFWSGQGPVKLSNGLIHDWIGSAFLPDTNIAKTLALIQDYDNHKNIYKPDVMSSKLIRRHHNDFQIYLRLLKKKILTVVLDTDHQVHYASVDSTRWVCRSHTTRVAEVRNPGTPKEMILPPDTGYGFLWRLSSYWRFQERDGGVHLECRAISLTRDVPLGLGWIIEPIIQKLPKESLIKTLESTRQGLHSMANSVRG